MMTIPAEQTHNEGPVGTEFNEAWGHRPQGRPLGHRATRNGPRHLKWWEALFVIALALFVFGAVLLPNTGISHREDAYRIADGDNLKGLMKAYVSALADKKREPANVGVSEGAQFWIAMYTTDGADEPSDVFLEPGDAGFLVSPKDPLMKEDEVILAIQGAKGPDVRINGKTISSYNGPTVATMQDMKTLSGKIIGCTGDRDGVPIFDDGVNVVYGNIKIEFVTWGDVGTIANNTAVPPRPTATTFVVPLGGPFALDQRHIVN